MRDNFSVLATDRSHPWLISFSLDGMNIGRYSVVLLACLSACTAPYGTTEQRGAVTYRAADWSGPDRRHTVDVRPQPVGGMRALLDHLDYPQSLRHQRIVGVARVRVALDSSGHVRSARIVQSAHPALDAIVIAAVEHTAWTPAQKNGRPVAYTITFPVTFSR
jgi:TonB family protein